MKEKTEKECKKCKHIKLINDFPLNSPDIKGRRYYMSKCKKCMSISVKPYVQKYMKENPEKVKIYQKNTNLKRAKLLKDLKIEGCKKCGDKRFYVIDFHHLIPLKKEFSISDVSMKRIKSEKDKCILLCSNCHREFHYLEKTKNISIKKFLENHG
jgi:hypothetical protein